MSERIYKLLVGAVVLFYSCRLVQGYQFCVTGASGYLGSEIVFQLLQTGQTVRAVCRSHPAHLQSWKDAYGDNLQIYSGLDLAIANVDKIEGVMRGCDSIIHTAAPFPVSCAGVDVAGPTLAALRNTLAACTRAGVSRVVVTSSAAACRGPRDVPSGSAGIFDEADWNLSSRADGPGMEPYQRAKTDAELAARAAAAPGGGGPEVVAILPTCLLGPVRGGPAACTTSNSVRMFRGWLGMDAAGGGGGAMVQSRLVCDVRDAAAAHVAAATLDSAVIGPTRFRRYLVGHGSRTPARDVRTLLLAAAAAAGRADVIVAPADPWTPTVVGAGGDGGAEMDTSRAVRELRGGRPLMPAAETVRAMADAILRLG